MNKHKNVKWFAAVLAAILAGALCASCASIARTQTGDGSGGRKAPRGVPKFITDALKNVEEDAILGYGTAKMKTDSLSLTVAESRARANISRQMNSMVEDMINDYQADSETISGDSAKTFFENCTQALSKSKLSGARVVEIEIDDNGAAWALMKYDKAGAAREINKAVDEAKLRDAKFAAFDAQKRMKAAFDRLEESEPTVTNN